MWPYITEEYTLRRLLPSEVGTGHPDIAPGSRRSIGSRVSSTRSLVVTCLGGFSLYVEGQRVDPSRWGVRNGGSQKVVGVMAYLIAHRHQPVPKGKLIDIFWDQADGDKGNQSLDRTISALRRALEPSLQKYQQSAYILGPRGGYRLSSDLDIAVDAEEFVACFKEAVESERKDGVIAAVPLYRRAEALYAGPFMSGVPYAELWCHYQSQILADYHRITLTRLAYAAWVSHDFDGITSYAHRVLGEYGCQGDVCGWLVDAYADGAAAAAVDRHIRTCPYRRQLSNVQCPEMSAVLSR